MSMTFKDGRYYFIEYLGRVDGKSKQKWHALTKERDTSIELMNAITSGTRGQEAIIEFVKKAFRSCKRRARDRELGIDITEESVVSMLKAQNFECAVTGKRFSLHQIRAHHGRPFAPSIDRIDPQLGYVVGNVRIVCVAANYAMNQWGEEVLDILLSSFMEKKRPDAAQRSAAKVLSEARLNSQRLETCP